MEPNLGTKSQWCWILAGMFCTVYFLAMIIAWLFGGVL